MPAKLFGIGSIMDNKLNNLLNTLAGDLNPASIISDSVKPGRNRRINFLSIIKGIYARPQYDDDVKVKPDLQNILFIVLSV